MKNYTIVPNNISNILDSGDTYRFTCLLFTPRKDGKTDSTFKQLAEYINKKDSESEDTVKKFVIRLKESGIIKIDEIRIADKRRNLFHIPDYQTDFRIIKKELLELDINIKLKGFMIQLFSIAINNTFDCNYSLNKIVSLIKVSKPTAQKYLAELVEKEHIIKTDTGYRLSNKYFSIGNKKDNEIIGIKKNIKDCTYLEERFNNTDWNNIANPVEYWRSVEGGYTSKKLDKVIENEIIVM